MPAITSLSQLTAIVSDGDFDASATAEFNKAVEAVEAGHGDATVTVTFKLKKDDRKVNVLPKVKATIPTKPVTSSTPFFVDSTGRLTDEDPRQLVIKEAQGRPKRVLDLDAERKARESQPASAATNTDPDKKGN